jgi:CRISPR-associated protein Cmr4
MRYRFALLFFQPITPLHVGCGQDVGVVDLPVIRERATGYPFVPGSGIRGSVRALIEDFERARPVATAQETGSEPDTARRPERSMTATLFGPPPGNEDSEEDEDDERYAGCVAVHDAKLLFFPVRSDQKVFLWLTCPTVLARFSRDVRAFLSPEENRRWEIEAGRLAGDDDTVVADADLASPLYLEEFSFALDASPEARAAWSRVSRWAAAVGAAVNAPEIQSRIVLVADRVFYDFVQQATLLLQHNRLTSAKTVEGGGLFSVEAVPPETIFYGFFGATRERRPAPAAEPASPTADTADASAKPSPYAPWEADQVLHTLKTLWEHAAPSGYFHLGGKESTGLGVTRLAWATDSEAPTS